MALLTLNEVGVFAALSAGPASAEALAETLGCDHRALTLLLNAGVSLELLEATDAGVANAADVAAFLVPGVPAYLGGALKYAYDVFPAWAGLARGVRTGEPQLAEEDYLGGDAERTERFVRAMHGRALGAGRGIAQAVDLSGCSALLDVGGGSGAYSILLCQRQPELRATVCDLDGIVAISALLVAEAGLSDRVATHAWDLRSDPLPAGHDAALVSGVLHRLSPTDARALVGRVRDALQPGGQVFLADVMLDDTGAGPPSAALFGVNMLLTAPGGGAHRAADHVEWLTDASFETPEILTLPPPALHTVVRARRA